MSTNKKETVESLIASGDFTEKDISLLRKRMHSNTLHQVNIPCIETLYALRKFRDVCGVSKYGHLVFFPAQIHAKDILKFSDLLSEYRDRLHRTDENIFLLDPPTDFLARLAEVTVRTAPKLLSYDVERLEKLFSWISDKTIRISKDAKFKSMGSRFKIVVSAADNMDLDDRNESAAQDLMERIGARLDRDIQNGALIHYHFGTSDGRKKCRIYIYSDSTKHVNFLKIMGMTKFTVSIPENIEINSNEEFDEYFSTLL